jgi:hypothetical protein
VFTRASHWSLSWVRWIQSVPPHAISKIRLNIILRRTSKSSYSYLSQQNLICILYCSHACYISCPYHPSPNGHYNYVWGRVQVTKLLITQFSSTFYHFFPLQSRYCPQHSILKHPQSMFSHNVTDYISRPYKTKCKIIVLYILIFMFLGIIRKYQTFWSEW